MRNKVFYEWKWEYSDKYGDIQDMEHADTLANIPEEMSAAGWDIDDDHWCVKVELCLVRTEGNEWEGLLDQTYAYPVKGELPEEFEDGTRVPMKKHKEFLNWNGHHQTVWAKEQTS